MDRKLICKKLDTAGIAYNNSWHTEELELLYNTHCEIVQPDIKMAIQCLYAELEQAVEDRSPELRAFVTAQMDQFIAQLKQSGLC